VAEIEIVWVPSAKVYSLIHGMVGQVRTFSLNVVPRPVELHCTLPGSLGSQEIQRLGSERAAYERAQEQVAKFRELFGRAFPPDAQPVIAGSVPPMSEFCMS
jgi:hypothetical protein